MAKSRELRQMSDEELLDLYEDNKEALYAQRRDFMLGELQDTSQFRIKRREIARILTILRERELAAALAQEEAN